MNEIAVLCRDVYYKKLIEFKYPNCIIIEEENDFAVSIKDGVEVIVSIRGSDDFEDWLDNLSFTSKKTKFGHIHSGMFDAYMEIRDSLVDAVTRTPFLRKLTICGHSKGGAMAQIFAVDIRGFLSCEIECITFASPRVGKSDFVKITKDSTVSFKRFTNRGDIVPFAIPWSFGYRHIGSPIKIGSMFKWGWGWSWRLLKRTKDIAKNHAMETYIKFLSDRT